MTVNLGPTPTLLSLFAEGVLRTTMPTGMKSGTTTTEASSEAWPKFPAEVSGNLTLDPPTQEASLQADWDTIRGIDTRIPRMSPEELRKFIREVLSGAIYLSEQVRRPEDIPLVFLVVALGGFANLSEEALQEIGVLWEYWDQALPRSINGQPTFASVRVLHREDWATAKAVIIREQERLENLDLGVR